jgi:hypothetical protein
MVKEKKSLSSNGKALDSCLNNMSARNFDSLSAENNGLETYITERIPSKSIPYPSEVEQIPFVESTYSISNHIFFFFLMPRQSANIFNFGNTTLFQAVGIWNFAQQSNYQVAGIVNITKKGRFQIGLVNVRDTAD